MKGAPLSKADITDEGTPFVLYGELYTTYGEVTHSIKRRTDKIVEPQFYSNVGDVIMPTSGETPEDIATASCIMLPDVILAGDLLIYRTQKVDGRLVSFVVKNKANKQISSVAQGKSVVHVRAEELSKISISYPSDAEQQKILTMLELLEDKITKQRELIEHLKKYKRGLSENIFSNLSCSTYELSNVCNIIGGGTPATGVLEYWNGDVSWFTPTEVGKKKYVTSSSRTITKEGLSKSSAKMLPPNTVLLTTRATLGEMSITTVACCTNQGFQSLIAKKDMVLPEYLYYLQAIIKPWCEKYSSGNTFREISKSALGKCAIPVPSLDEQTRIVGCLSLVDAKIEKCELMLENLLKIKSALVQRLFI